MAYELQKKPWKVWMSSAPDPTAVLASAYDLLNGLSLGHDILIYNGNLYSNGIFTGSSFDDFYRYEIDMSPALFDKRSKFRVEQVKSNYFTSLIDTNLANIYIYDKDAALYPENLKSFYAVNSKWKSFFRSNSTLTSDTLEVGYKTLDFMSTESVSDDDFSDVSSDIIVYTKDSVFTSTMVFEDGKEAFTKLKLNTNSTKVQKMIVGAFFFNSDTKMPDYAATIGYSDIFSYLLQNCTEQLQHIYFWVKAPFCADYIDPADFNQDLNQDADVVHRNMLLSNNYDGIRNNFNRYHESVSFDTQSATISDFLEKLSRPYVPTNSPLKDLLSKKLGEGIGADIDSVSEAAKTLIENSYEDDHIIGSVLSVPGTEGESPDQSTTRYTPFNFYDPESREKEDYYEELGRIPTLIGRDGNLTTDGRLMSPTIDELWYIIKKLISGQPAAEYSRDNDHVASPFSENATNSTILEEAVQAQYNIDGITIDPIDFEYESTNNEITGIKVKEFTVQPDKVEHHVYKLLKVISTRINTFYESQNEIDDTITETDDGKIYNGASRDITRTGENLVIGTTKMSQLSLSDSEYGPRSEAPLSLRELEAAMLGNKYNIENNFMFIAKTYAVTGKFGKKVEDDEGNIISAGSLYQMHRDYNAQVESPNTYFKMGATGDEGRDATFGDLNGETEKVGDIDVYLLDENNRRTTTVKTSSMPLLVENYGKSHLLAQEQGEYTGADIYMAADGTWRYKAEHMRLPILRSRY